MKYCIIDIGSNTVKASFYEVGASAFECVDKYSVKCSLGLCRENGRLNEVGCDRLLEVITRYASIAEKKGCGNISAVATASLRSLSNADDVVELVRAKCGVDIDMICGEDEAIYSFYGLLSDIPDARDGIMIDMGGGSTELVGFECGKVTKSVSLPFGSLLLKAHLGVGEMPSASDERGIREYISSFDELAAYSSPVLYSIGGTARGIFTLYGKLNGKKTALTANELQDFYSELKGSEGIGKLIAAELPERADSIMCGFYALCTLCEATHAERLVLCRGSVREGYLLKKVLGR